ncbi:D-TA family PLP-dependent enzyme [Bacteroides sp. 51]|uniref:D-TA family PLP-dependent enzyme n=1 Tax=Bacteroides sp. 51 TaxID=2302938 RepID=UPI0013CFCEDD|nr:D-TA family PLP-dependent enzyme [Bacteroides sp. 51]NDV83759.1 D-TA family PLP-dependent enzyme [Bacteroides sp. 51]
MLAWYQIKNVERIDSPALLVYPDRVQENINLVIDMVEGNVERLRPHVKTNKITEICRMMLLSGITKFKCATIAEAEMLAIAGAPDILLAYQPVGPTIPRLFNLQKAYPNTRFSCLVDNEIPARELASACRERGTTLHIYIDLNVGMNRTGILPADARALAEKLLELEPLHLDGIHAYDGHIHARDFEIRQEEALLSYSTSRQLQEELESLTDEPLTLIIGGTPAFPIHAGHTDCECSPGTFIFWDWGYSQMIEELPCKFAALVLTRVISIIDQHHICVDLGYKAVAAESPLPRVHFLNAPSALPVAHSEEHLVLEVTDSGEYPIGTPLYGVPVHICPTVALHDRAHIIHENQLRETWEVIARKRFINY